MSSYTDDLVNRLNQGDHKVVFESRTKTLEEIKKRIDDGFVFITFTQTRGGTELGINLEKSLCDFSKMDASDHNGMVHIVGNCELNFVKVRCVADVDLQTREGKGHLEIL